MSARKQAPKSPITDENRADRVSNAMEHASAAVAAENAIKKASGETTADTNASQGRAGVTKRGTAYMIDPTTIGRVEGFNPRIEFGEIKDLAASIQTHLLADPESGGLLNDIRVARPATPRADGKLFDLIDGDRRFTAIEYLMKKGVEFPHGVPAKIDPRGITVRDRLVRMYTSNTGKQFTPLEEAISFARLRDAGMTVTEIAAATGKSRAGVTFALVLMDSTQEITKAIEDKLITAGQGKEIAVAAHGDPELQKSLLKELIDAGKDKGKKLAVKTKVKAVRNARIAKKGAKVRKDKAVNTAMTSEHLTKLGGAVSDKMQEMLSKLGMTAATDVAAWLKGGDDSIKTGYVFGILQGLIIAAGQPVDMFGVL